MKHQTKILQCMGMTLLACTSHAADTLARKMNVRQGPETVFAQPVEGLFDELAGAQATGMNGRVGNELVFWGYTLADGNEAYLFACAMLPDVDCEQRQSTVCANNTKLLARTQLEGKVRHLNCRSIAVEPSGAVRPGCQDTEQEHSLDVGIIQCN